jgi:hypothetical protein
MDERTEAIIRELSDKLGTTGEHLWGVLVSQAPITGVIDLIVMAAWVFLIVMSFKFIHKKTTVPKGMENSPYQHADWEEEVAALAWGGWAITTLLTLLVVGGSLSGTISAIINPEYWALKQLLP